MDLSALKPYQLPIGLSVAGIALILIGSVVWGADEGSVVIGTGVISALAGFMVYLNKRPDPAAANRAPVLTTPVSDGERQQILQNRLSQLLTSGQGRIESSTPYAATVITGQKVNHILHLLISIFACGLWLPVWLVLSQTGGEKRQVLAVDACGNIASTP